MINNGFINQKKFYWNKDNVGKFCVILPLYHIFNVCENYRKVLYDLRGVY